MRIAAISDWNVQGSLAETVALDDHISTKITTRHYIRFAIKFNPITPKQARSKRLK